GTKLDCWATAVAASRVYAASAPRPFAAVIGVYPGGSRAWVSPGCWPEGAADWRDWPRSRGTSAGRPFVRAAPATILLPGDAPAEVASSGYGMGHVRVVRSTVASLAATVSEASVGATKCPGDDWSDALCNPYRPVSPSAVKPIMKRDPGCSRPSALSVPP